MSNTILDLCGGTGAWARPFKNAGYTVHTITLPVYDITAVSFTREHIAFTSSTAPLIVGISDVYGVLAAPPCTEFSVAKNSRLRDFETGMKLVSACLEIIWHIRKNHKLQFWAMENPKGFLRQFLGIPRYTFEQWQFGGTKIKPTDIWGYFNPPEPAVQVMPAEVAEYYGQRGHSADYTVYSTPPEYAEYLSQFKGDARRAALRAIIPQGFAEAFFKANSVAVVEPKDIEPPAVMPRVLF